MYTPEENVDAIQQITQARLKVPEKYDCRMVKGEGPNLDWSKVFGFIRSAVTII